MTKKKEEVKAAEVTPEAPTEEVTEVTPDEVAKPKRAKKKKAVSEPVLAKREKIGSKEVVSCELVDGMVYVKDSVGSGFKFTLDQWNSGDKLS